MRVIHVAPTPFGSEGLFGGGERYPLELARAMARSVDCELVTFGPRPSRSRESGGLRIRVLRSIGRIGGHPVNPVGPGLPAALAGADVVHAHQMRSVPAVVAALSARARGQSIAVTDHGLGRGRRGGALLPLFDRFLLASRFSALELGVPAARSRIIYGGVDTERFQPAPAASRRGVLFVGRITPHKGLERLIEALPEGAELTVAGSVGHDPRPPERDYPLLLRRISTGRPVRFLGPVSERELQALYRRAAVFVLPSVERTCFGKPVRITELLGLSVLEAMASGTPVVCSRTGGLPEVVRDGETGFLVTPGDVDALRDRLSTLLSDRVLAERLGRNGRELVLERFTWERCAVRCLDAYEQMVGASRRRGLAAPWRAPS
jgi:glycosyltransferase involved in cell wall biosynthesis